MQEDAHPRSYTTATTAVEVSESTTTTVESSNEKQIPKFCLKLKFNCKLLSFHPCCRHQAPASKSTLVKVTQEKVKEPKELQQETVNKDEEEDNLKHEVKETASEKKPLFPKKEKNKSSSFFKRAFWIANFTSYGDAHCIFNMGCFA